MDIPWDDVKLFLAVAETGSLSAAASRLRVAQPTVSRRLADLEATLGEPLFSRSVQGAAVTAFGERLLAPAKRMAEQAAELERTAAQADSTPRGAVRVTAPPGLAFDWLAPFAAHVRAALPEVTLEIVSSVQYLDLSRREADLALRYQRPTQRDHEVLATVEHAGVPFASRAYADSLPRKPRPQDVAWIAWAPPLDHVSPNPELARMIPGFRPVFASDDFIVQIRACQAGLGVLFLGRIRHRFSTVTSLVELDLGLPEVPAALHLVSTRSALTIARVRVVADLLTEELNQADTRPPPRKRR